MCEPKVWVFFYGSVINRQVLARGGFVPDQIEVALVAYPPGAESPLFQPERRPR